MDRCHVLSYVNGLALVRDGPYNSFDRDVISWIYYGNYSSLRKILLWNPSINKCIKVPRPLGIISDLDLGLGFDASKNDYKLVLLMYPPIQIQTDNQGGLVLGLVQIYTLSTNSWVTKPDVHPPSRCLVGSQVFFNGTIHWMAFGKSVVVDGSVSIINNDRLYIVRFEVVDEVFSDLELPIRVVDVPTEDSFLTVMEGCLAMFCGNPSEHDIWVMKDYGNSSSWMKCYTFSLKYSKPLYLKGNGEFLYAKDGLGIKSYDVKKNQVRDLARPYCKTSNYMIYYTYVESLVLSSAPVRVTEN
ncbi:F-box protein CPR1-like [Silene latifolia]|uniref:F-box protein CPR1-like n=1 Tax=Silene latifolia TaxID=37657 RepID=UPI003D76B109